MFTDSIKILLLLTTMLVVPSSIAQTNLDDCEREKPGRTKGHTPVPSGQCITPTFATGAVFAPLRPEIAEDNEAIGNYSFFQPSGAIASTLSPDGKTLAVMTSGYNLLFGGDGKLLQPPSDAGFQAGAEFVELYDVSNPRFPIHKQTLRPANTFVGLAFLPDGSKLYVSGGNDDQVVIYALGEDGRFKQSGVIPLGHGKTAVGINGQYPQTGGLALSWDGSLLAVANTLNNSISVFRTADNYRLFEYDLRPYNTTPGCTTQNSANSKGEVAKTWDSKKLAHGETIYSVVIMDGPSRGKARVYATSVRDREVVVFDFSIVGMAQHLMVDGTPHCLTYIPLPGNPNNLLLNKMQTKLYVTQDNSDTVAVIDTTSNDVKEIDAIAPSGLLANSKERYTGAGTNNLALSPDERWLYVTNGGANDLAIISIEKQTVVGLIPTGWYPTTVTVSVDGSTLYIFNNKSDPGKNPKHATEFAKKLAKVTYGGSNKEERTSDPNQYVLQLEQSGMLTVPVPKPEQWGTFTGRVARNNCWKPMSCDDGKKDQENDDETMSFLHKHIKHVIYIVKENRTFDQILGDLYNGSNGDPELTVFGWAITPNFHRLATDFVTLDNFYCSGEVSGVGWAWSTAGRETDWVEKNIPMHYTGDDVTRGKAPYDSQGQNNNVPVGYRRLQKGVKDWEKEDGEKEVQDRKEEVNSGGEDYEKMASALPGGVRNLLPGTNDSGAPDGPKDQHDLDDTNSSTKQRGYIWSAALRKGRTMRNYGFLTSHSSTGRRVEHPYRDNERQVWATTPELIEENRTDIYFRGFDTTYPDFWRFEEFKREFQDYDGNCNTDKKLDLPQLILLRYPGDHMGEFEKSVAGTDTPEKQQADNDYAVGKTIELVAHSRYASCTLIFILEDDAQDGGDHMDAMRSTAYVVGPYVRKHEIISAHYSTVNMLRTIEDVLDLGHLNLNTFYQRPMSKLFNIHQDAKWSYDAVASTVLKRTGLDLPAANDGKTVEFFEGPDIVPTHPASWWAEKTGGFDWSTEDRVPADLFNRIVWQGMKGDKPYPKERSGKKMGATAPEQVPLEERP